LTKNLFLNLEFSIIIPVYNRPEELEELLQSILNQKESNNIEVIIIEDGSVKKSNLLIDKYIDQLNLKYYFKKNTGPGDSRNYGMERALGNYFIILDSDCLLPENYLSVLSKSLNENYADAFGGPDAAHSSFSNKQKAINYSMTSFLSTGGLRGAAHETKNFQLRSFNMGLSKEAFLLTGGFSKQRIGEDIDLNYRLKDKNLSRLYIADAFVYHKRRTSWFDFFKQIRNFGAARPVLNKLHPGSGRITYWLPSLFILGLIFSLLSFVLSFPAPLMLYLMYFLAVGIDSFIKNKQLAVAILSMLAVFAQFLAYGTGFLRSVLRLHILRKSAMDTFPKMFA
jgi:glycosyltransferase involved in cell wall biosynthesis